MLPTRIGGELTPEESCRKIISHHRVTQTITPTRINEATAKAKKKVAEERLCNLMLIMLKAIP